MNRLWLAAALLLLPRCSRALATIEKTDYILDQLPYPFLPLQAGQTQLSFAPVLKNTWSGYEAPLQSKSRMAGLELQLRHALSDHFALGLHLGAAAARRETHSDLGSGSDLTDTFAVIPLGLHAVFDPFSRGWNFRLPFFASYTYGFMTGRAVYKPGSGSRQEASFTGSSPQLGFGMAPQAGFGPLRAALVYAFLKNQRQTFHYVYDNGSPDKDFTGSPDVYTGALGLELGVPSWGLSLAWTQLSVDYNQQDLRNAVWRLQWARGF